MWKLHKQFVKEQTKLSPLRILWPDEPWEYLSESEGSMKDEDLLAQAN
jgi:hypothetical protein